MSELEYEITYTIRRSRRGSGEPEEIGFGASSQWTTIGAALHAMSSDIDNYLWETGPGMPDPYEIKTEMEDY